MLKAMFLCEDVREGTNGRLDILGVFQQIAVTGFPAAIPVMFVTIWANLRGPEDDMLIELVSPGMEPLQIPVRILTGDSRYDTLTKFRGDIVANKPGDLVVRSYLNGTLFGEWRIPIWFREMLPAL